MLSPRLVRLWGTTCNAARSSPSSAPPLRRGRWMHGRRSRGRCGGSGCSATTRCRWRCNLTPAFCKACAGYIEGKDFVSELRTADGSFERLPSFADELVRSDADVLLANAAAAVLALQKATRTIPIVMAGTVDPVAAGFIDSLARPGGNTTGVAVQHCRNGAEATGAAGGHPIQSIPDRTARESASDKLCAVP
jgi:hypothetical protein